MSKGFAAGLINLGMRREHVACIVLPNIPEYASVLIGIWDAGGIASPINPTYTSGWHFLNNFTRLNIQYTKIYNFISRN